MSVVIAFQSSFGMVVASDGRITQGDVRLTDKCRKFVVHQSWAVGIAGSMRTISLLTSKLEITPQMDAVAVSDKIKHLLKEDGYFDHAKEGDGPLLGPDQMFLVSKDTIFSMSHDFTPIQIDIPYLAVGSGGPYASGYLYREYTKLKNPTRKTYRTLIRDAILCAEFFDVNCGGEPQILIVGE